MINCDACGFGHKEHHEVKICHLEAQVERLTQELVKCGRENCMGQINEGMATWVRKEKLIELRQQVVSLRRYVAHEETCPQWSVEGLRMDICNCGLDAALDITHPVEVK